jgi:5-carboxymethyl-2-hydroxymuconate isomerase
MSELKIKGTDEKIKVENIFCIGKNYVDHIKEFDTPEAKAEIPKEPVIFLKPTSAISDSGYVSIPEINGKKISDNLQNEVELVIIIGKDGGNIPENKAMDYVLGYSVGIDFTLRDIQAEQKKKGLPWTTSKGFMTSSPVSDIVLKEHIENVSNLDISLKINGEIKQDANTSLMIFKIPFIVHYISCIFGLKKGDVIFTGTPAGITKLNPGDKIEAEIERIGKINIKVR